MQVMSGRMLKMASDVMNEEYGITKKDFRGVFWRSFTLLGSMNYERMEALGFLYAIFPILKKSTKMTYRG